MHCTMSIGWIKEISSKVRDVSHVGPSIMTKNSGPLMSTDLLWFFWCRLLVSLKQSFLITTDQVWFDVNIIALSRIIIINLRTDRITIILIVIRDHIVFRRYMLVSTHDVKILDLNVSDFLSQLVSGINKWSRSMNIRIIKLPPFGLSNRFLQSLWIFHL